MPKVILYTIGCPKCEVLKAKLDQKGVAYEEFTSVPEMLAMGINKVPTLSVDSECLNFTQAVAWINEQ